MPAAPLAAELTSKVQHAEQAAAYPQEEGAHAAQVATLASTRAEAQENVDSMNRRLQVGPNGMRTLRLAGMELQIETQASPGTLAS